MEMVRKATLRQLVLQSREAIELLSDKWRISVLHLLEGGTLRTNELQRAIEEVSPKMLTQTLRRMERDGLISRAVHHTSPPRVEYKLTKMGASVIPPIRKLCHWAKTHLAERDASRARYDLAAKRPRQNPRLPGGK